MRYKSGRMSMKRFVRLVSISVALLMWLGIAIDSGIPPAALAQSNSWTEITPAAGPGTRWAYRAVVNQSNRRMIMFAGADNFFGGQLNDTWVLSNADGIVELAVSRRKYLPGSAQLKANAFILTRSKGQKTNSGYFHFLRRFLQTGIRITGSRWRLIPSKSWSCN